MNDNNTATLRTGVNTVLASIAVVLLSRWFGWEVASDDPTLILLVGAAVTFFYRLSVVVADKWPSIGYLLFGTKREPTYLLPPPPPPNPDRGWSRVDVMFLVAMVAVVLLLIWIW